MSLVLSFVVGWFVVGWFVVGWFVVGGILALIFGYMRYRTIVKDFFDPDIVNAYKNLEKEIRYQFNQEYKLQTDSVDLMWWLLIIGPITVIVLSIRNLFVWISGTSSGFVLTLSKHAEKKHKKEHPDLYI